MYLFGVFSVKKGQKMWTYSHYCYRYNIEHNLLFDFY